MQQTDDEALMALADGEITGAQAERLRSRIAEEPELAARYALFAATARLAGQSARADPRAEVSGALVARVRAMGGMQESPAVGTVVPLRQRPRPAWHPAAVAACLALAAGVGAGMFMARLPQAPDLALLGAAVTGALDSVPSGTAVALGDGRRLTPVASFRDGSGRFCREYETEGPETAAFVSVACRDGETWLLQFAMARGAQAERGYAPASAPEVLDAALAAMGARAPMLPEEERGHLR